MATTTTNIGLTKPDGTENVSRQVINGNWDLIDAAFGQRKIIEYYDATTIASVSVATYNNYAEGTQIRRSTVSVSGTVLSVSVAEHDSCVDVDAEIGSGGVIIAMRKKTNISTSATTYNIQAKVRIVYIPST